MRRIGRTAWMIAIGLMALGGSSTRSDDAPKPDPKAIETADRVLTEWYQHASKITTLDVQFRRTDHPAALGDDHFTGRAILASPNLAIFECSRIQKNGASHPEDRWVFNGRDAYWFTYLDHKVHFFKGTEEWSHPPIPLCLPFLFTMTVEQAKENHDWEVISDDEKTVVLKATDRREKGFFDPVPHIYLIELDKKTFLPRKISLPDPNSPITIVYENFKIEVNSKAANEWLKKPALMKNPVPKTWRVFESSIPSAAESERIRERNKSFQKEMKSLGDLIRKKLKEVPLEK